MTKILSEDEIKKAHLKKEISPKDYASSGVPEKPPKPPVDHSALEIRQVKAMEEIAAALRRFDGNGKNQELKELLTRVIELQRDNQYRSIMTTPKKKKWSFKIERNSDGFISRVVAEEI